MTWSPPAEPLPAHTPIPEHVDKQIDDDALRLARRRADLSPGQQLILASNLAYRARTYRREDPHTR